MYLISVYDGLDYACSKHTTIYATLHMNSAYSCALPSEGGFMIIIFNKDAITKDLQLLRPVHSYRVSNYKKGS